MFVLNSSICMNPASFELTLSKFGSLDILVNNAGLFKEKMWEAVLNVNLVGTDHVHPCLDLLPKYYFKRHSFDPFENR